MSSVLSLLVLVPSTALAEDANKSVLPEPEPFVQVHVWGTVLDQDVDRTADPAGYGDPEHDTGFTIRRARVGINGRDDTWRYGVIIGQSAPFDGLTALGGTHIDIVDAFGAYSPTEGLWITGGVQKVPVSRELIMSSQRLVLVERSVASEWLIPGRDTGLTVDYRLGSESRYANLSAGVYNGNRSLISDDNPGKLFAARGEFVIGDANPYRTFGSRPGVTFAIAGDVWSNTDVATQTLGFGADMMLRAGGLSVTAEGRMADIAPGDSTIGEPGVLSETRRLGALAQVGYTVGRYEPAVRFSMFDDDADADDNGDVADVVVGVTRSGRNASWRLGGGYVHRMELGGVATRNDTARLWLLVRL
jgi:hypothetical protein